jgi:hypothetical protein
VNIKNLINNLQVRRSQTPNDGPATAPPVRQSGGGNRAAAASMREAVQARGLEAGETSVTVRFSMPSATSDATAAAPAATGVRQRVRRQYASLRNLAQRCGVFLSTRSDLKQRAPTESRTGSSRPSSTAQVSVQAPPPRLGPFRPRVPTGGAAPTPHANVAGPSRPIVRRTSPEVEAAAAVPTPVIDGALANGAFKAMFDVSSQNLQAARSAQRQTARALQEAQAALVAVPAPTEAELAARAGPAAEARDTAVREAAEAWETAMGTNRRPAQGPYEATFRPPENDIEGYTARWDSASAIFSAASRRASEAYDAAINPPRAAAIQVVVEAQAADTAAAAAIDAAQAAFLQVATLERASR